LLFSGQIFSAPPVKCLPVRLCPQIQTFTPSGMIRSIKARRSAHSETTICIMQNLRTFGLIFASSRLQVLIVAEEWKQKAGRFLRSLPQG